MGRQVHFTVWLGILGLPGQGRQKMKKTILMIFLVAAVLMMLGCAEIMKEGGWVRPHGTADDFYRDRTECANEAKKGSLANEQFDLLFSRCLQSKGYSWQQEGYSWQEDPW